MVEKMRARKGGRESERGRERRKRVEGQTNSERVDITGG